MSTGIVYLHKRVNAYFKTRRVIFLFMKQSPHIFNIHVKPRLLQVEIWSSQRNALGEHALAPLWRWFFLSVSHQDKTVAQKVNWRGMVWLSAEKRASGKGAKTPVACRGG